MNIISTAIPDVKLIEPKIFPDQRGFFFESFHRQKFADNGIDIQIMQANCSKSDQHILRGLHYQLPPHAQDKLVMVLEGEVFDVAVDIRKNSPTFGKWVGETLSHDNKKMLYIPKGFAHGFYVKSPSALFYYLCTDFYHPASEQSILWNDPDININWPLPENQEPSLSPKDIAGVPLRLAQID